jgi:hypothetical protein
MEMIAKDTLEAEDVRAMSEQLLRKHLSLETEGYKGSTSMALNVLLTARGREPQYRSSVRRFGGGGEPHADSR